MSAVRALILDFDGLIVDTESPVFESWRRIYAEHGVELPREDWNGSIGSAGGFDPLAHLQAQLREPLDVEALNRRRRGVRDGLLAHCGPLPGVVSALREARSRGLGLGIASSSPRDWVEGHLRRLELLEAVDLMVTEDDVARAKPDPELYLGALAALGVTASQAIAFEDSPNGVTAAKAAGIYCVAVPGPMTQGLDFSRADLVVASLEERSLTEFLERPEQ